VKLAEPMEDVILVPRFQGKICNRLGPDFDICGWFKKESFLLKTFTELYIIL
jgi:hypothetical protein